jgi:hypothetical protein
MSKYGSPADHNAKLNDWLPESGGYSVMHSWYEMDNMAAYHVVNKVPTEGDPNPKLYFIRTFYIGEFKPENVEISIDKMAWPNSEVTA